MAVLGDFLTVEPPMIKSKFRIFSLPLAKALRSPRV
jgi:hypothetical protein